MDHGAKTSPESVGVNHDPAAAERFEARDRGKLAASTRKKPHLLVPWLADLVRHPRFVAPVANLLGPDLLCWSSLFFTKEPRRHRLTGTGSA